MDPGNERLADRTGHKHGRYRESRSEIKRSGNTTNAKIISQARISQYARNDLPGKHKTRCDVVVVVGVVVLLVVLFAPDVRLVRRNMNRNVYSTNVAGVDYSLLMFAR